MSMTNFCKKNSDLCPLRATSSWQLKDMGIKEKEKSSLLHSAKFNFFVFQLHVCLAAFKCLPRNTTDWNAYILEREVINKQLHIHLKTIAGRELFWNVRLQKMHLHKKFCYVTKSTLAAWASNANHLSQTWR